MNKLYDGLGEAANSVNTFQEARQLFGVLLKGDALPMPYISEDLLGTPVRMNRKFSGKADELLTAGMYRIGTDATGTPSDGSLAWMEVFLYIEGNGDVHAMQRYLADGGSAYHHRWYDNGTWSGWA